MTKEKLIEWALAHGWKMDRRRHLTKGRSRVHLSDTQARLERVTSDGFVRLASGYYSALRITENDKIGGMS